MLELPLLLIDLVASFAIAASSVGLFKLEKSLYRKESIDEKTSKESCYKQTDCSWPLNRLQSSKPWSKSVQCCFRSMINGLS